MAFSPRIAKSAFYAGALAAGADRFTVYNHTLMPVSYGDELAEYWRLIDSVAMWDVAAQVQVELVGPDASTLVQALVCRDLSNTRFGQAKYAPMVDHCGRLINDPLLLRVETDRWWLSLADSDMVFWCRAVTAERGMDVVVNLPDVSPLAIQGPLSEDVVSAFAGRLGAPPRGFPVSSRHVGGHSSMGGEIRLVEAGWFRVIPSGSAPGLRSVAAGGRSR